MSMLQQQSVPVSQKTKDQFNARAQQIVLNLIDGPEDEEIFLEQLQWINQNHYKDVVEERAITKLCGYPLCCQQLGMIPKKKYHISLTLNKVYDITERKMFCSNNCYKASSYLKQQLFTSPLWFRDKTPNFTLLTMDERGSFGEEINFGVERVQILKENQDVSEDQMNSERTEVTDANEQERAQYPRNLKSNHASPETFFVDFSEQFDGPNLPVESPISDTLQFEEAGDQRGETEQRNSREFIKLLESPVSSKHLISSSRAESVLESNTISSDKTDSDTYVNEKECAASTHSQNDESRSEKANIHLQAKTTPANHKSAGGVTNSIVKIRVITKRIETPEDSKHSPKVSEQIQVPIMKTENSHSKTVGWMNETSVMSPADVISRVERCLREWLTVDSLCHVVGTKTVTQSMRDKGRTYTSDRIKSDPLMYERYTALCKKLKILEIEEEKYEKKAAGFEMPTKPLPDFAALQEQAKEMEIKVKSFYRGDLKVSFAENHSKDEDEPKPHGLPPLHQHAKNAIRRNIVLDRLKIVLADLSQMMGLDYVDVCGQVKKLLLTCRFSAHNITFKPPEWNLIGLVLLKLLSVQDDVLQCRLRDKSNYVNALLMSYQLENNYLELLCSWLTDVDLILKNENSKSGS